MPHIIRVNEEFNGKSMNKIKQNSEQVLQQILDVSTLRAFFDCTNQANLKISNSRVSKIYDLSSNELHFVQSNTSNQPVYSQDAIDGVGGLVFEGNHWLTSDGLLNQNSTKTIVVFFKASKKVTANAIILSPKNVKYCNMYYTPTSLKALSGAVIKTIKWANAKKHNFIHCYDFAKNQFDIYTQTDKANGNYTGVMAFGDVNLGRWADEDESIKFRGEIGHVAVFDECVSDNTSLLKLLREYATSKYMT